jgi:EAL domain-containing protein (putative c-di-GMP-specific phosphodiesterase class I)
LRALRDGRFDVWFQPIMDLRTGHIAGAEALIRMIDDDGTVRAAGSFVPALQAAGYAEDITRAVIAAALPAFASAEVTERGWYLTLNLSERDLANPSIIDLLADGIRRSGVDPTRLVVEVSEQVDPNGALLHAVESVRELGVGIALDDFGAGSSTFGQIAGLSPSVLKLDIGLLPVIGPAPSGLQSAELVDAFTRLAHHLNMTVVAEGVESEEQRRILEGLGCDHAQGYLWSPAVPLADLLAMAAEETTAPLRTGTDG